MVTLLSFFWIKLVTPLNLLFTLKTALDILIPAFVLDSGEGTGI